MSNELVDATVQLIKDTISTQSNRQSSPFCFATFEDIESVDANLSIISFADGSTVRGVPKCTDTVLVSGDTVVCLSPNSQMPMVIVGVLRGDARLFTG